jgi:hypothetical protein
MNSYKTIGPHHYSFCPVCKGSVAFYKPLEGSFTGGEQTVSIEDQVRLECRVHGNFEVSTRDLHNAAD